MTEADKLYLETNKLPNRDFYVMSGLSFALDFEDLEAAIKFINDSKGTSIFLEENFDIIAYGKDIPYAKECFSEDVFLFVKNFLEREV